MSACAAHHTVHLRHLPGVGDRGFPTNINKLVLTEMPWLDPGALLPSPKPGGMVRLGHEPKHTGGKFQDCAASCSCQGKRANSKATCAEVS